MTGKTIPHYPAFRDPARRDKIIAKLGEACPAKGSRQARGGMSSLVKNHRGLIPSTGPSFSKKYNNLVPQGGRRLV